MRTAAHLKGIPLQFSFVKIPSREHQSDVYAALNPSRSVPTLSFTLDNGTDVIIRQSIAILEFFEDSFPHLPPLLPPASDLLGRVRVRKLVNNISNDVQPPTNMRILNRVRDMNGDADRWAEELMYAGLSAFDQVAREKAGIYSHGDEVTWADIVLAPAVENAIRYGIDLDLLPTVKRIYNNLKQLEAFKLGD